MLFSAPGCHLCDEAQRLFEKFEKDGTVSVEMVNIRTAPELEREFGLRIPVARFRDGAELAWPFTSDEIAAILKETTTA